MNVLSVCSISGGGCARYRTRSFTSAISITETFGFAALFERVDALYGLLVRSVAANAPDSIGGVKYDAAVAKRGKALGDIVFKFRHA